MRASPRSGHPSPFEKAWARQTRSAIEQNESPAGADRGEASEVAEEEPLGGEPSGGVLRPAWEDDAGRRAVPRQRTVAYFSLAAAYPQRRDREPPIKRLQHDDAAVSGDHPPRLTAAD